ncbi:hypothetical protein K402DRAFT_355696 [Aulographum hederae CBS 113979]|uniref:Zn(2)-C6 fungal-type domain-containing protein n=1 Tax=Aulographum hederae CBS 113979 TaxID=1176131 RepID=A0A6G1GZH3_9PEZI|nr:hypothetical protein K402DRAFT_355696 [Aulographum hederae CBS 113979]
MDSDEHAERERKPKRQKVAVACDECRHRKVKCDGVRPVCAPCLRRYGPGGSHCSWDAGSRHVAELEDKIRRLQAERESKHESNSPDSRRQIGTPHSSNAYPSHVVRREASSNGHANSVPNGNRHDSFSGRSMGSTSEVRAAEPMRSTDLRESSDLKSPEDTQPGPISAIVGAVSDEAQAQGFYGGSSIGSFIDQVRKAIEDKIESPGASQRTSSSAGPRPFPVPFQQRSRSTALEYVLPNRRTADSLLDTYWTIVHPMYPFLDKDDTRADYENLWTGNGPSGDEQSFVCIINTIFALSSQITETIKPQEREAQANVFFQRARESMNMWQAGSLRSVQMFLLIAQYLQSTNDAHECWMFVGLAVRTAQSLGIHLPEMSDEATSAAARELLRRVWHGCVLMDRTTAMTYGRPVMIHKNIADRSVPLPVAEDMTTLKGHYDRAVGATKTIMGSYIESLKLFRILYEVLTHFYASDPRRIRSIDESFLGRTDRGVEGYTILDLDQSLTEWHRSLPDNLRHLPEPRATGILARQAVVLRQRFLHVRILTLRPILSAYVLSTMNDDVLSPATVPLSSRIALQCSVACVQTAQEAISLVHSRFPSDTGHVGNLAEWWYNIMYIYTAATILVAARLNQSITSDVSEDSIMDSWYLAIATLQRFECYGVTVKRLIAILEVLFHQIPQRYLHFRQQGSGMAIDPSSPKQAATATQVSGPPVQLSTETAPASQPFMMPETNSQFAAPVSGIATPYFTFQDLDSTDFRFDPSDLSWLNSLPFDS